MVPRGPSFRLTKCFKKRNPGNLLKPLDHQDSRYALSDNHGQRRFRLQFMKWTYCILVRHRRRPVQSACAAMLFLIAAYVVSQGWTTKFGWIFGMPPLYMAVVSLFHPPGWITIFVVVGALASVSVGDVMFADQNGSASLGWVFVFILFIVFGFFIGGMVELKLEDQEFLRGLGKERGPEVCRRDGCQRKHIALSVLCRKHHFEMVRIDHPEEVSKPFETSDETV